MSLFQLGDSVALSKFPCGNHISRRRCDGTAVENAFTAGEFASWARRVGGCATRVAVAEDHAPDAKNWRVVAGNFCRVRLCPMCMCQRALRWQARFYEALPKIRGDNPHSEFIFLTVTVKNCDVKDLKSTLRQMSKGWKSLTQNPKWPGLGYVRSTEVTRGVGGTAHPHFHAILQVHSSYFSGQKYLSQKKWTQLWKESSKLDYTPIVHVRKIRPKVQSDELQLNFKDALQETFKYCVKAGKESSSKPEWFCEVAKQLHATKATNLGGTFKKYFNLKSIEDLEDELQIEGVEVVEVEVEGQDELQIEGVEVEGQDELQIEVSTWEWDKIEQEYFKVVIDRSVKES